MTLLCFRPFVLYVLEKRQIWMHTDNTSINSLQQHQSYIVGKTRINLSMVRRRSIRKFFQNHCFPVVWGNQSNFIPKFIKKFNYEISMLGHDIRNRCGNHFYQHISGFKIENKILPVDLSGCLSGAGYVFDDTWHKMPNMMAQIFNTV